MSKVKNQVEQLRGGIGSYESEHFANQPPVLEIKLANGRHHMTTNPEELLWFFNLGGTGTKQPPKKSKRGKSKGARNRTKQKVRRTSNERD